MPRKKKLTEEEKRFLEATGKLPKEIDGVSEDIKPVNDWLNKNKPQAPNAPNDFSGEKPIFGKKGVDLEDMDKLKKMGPSPEPENEVDEVEQIMGKHARYGVATASNPNIVPASYFGINQTNEKGEPLAGIDLSKMSYVEKLKVLQRLPADKLKMWDERNKTNAGNAEQFDREFIERKVQGWLSEYNYRVNNNKPVPEEWHQTYKDLQGKTLEDIYKLWKGEEQ
jgi:hypothetical protein